MNPNGFPGMWNYNPFMDNNNGQQFGNGSYFNAMHREASSAHYSSSLAPFQTMPSSSSSCSPSVGQTSNDNSSFEQESSKGRSYDKWTEEAEKCLVALWCEKHTRLESKNARKVWDEIATAVSKVKEVTVAQCQRKIKYLKDKYQKAKDHNRNQTGGSPATSPFYKELDSILGCRDAVKLHNIEESEAAKANSSKSSSSGNVSDEDSEDDDFFGFAKGKKRRQQERKERKQPKIKTPKRKKTEGAGEEDDEAFNKSLEKLNEQSGRLTNVLESMEKNQSEQLKLMNNFMQGFLQAMSKQ